VAQSSSAAHQIASRYARALIDTASNAGALESVEKDMTDLRAMLNASEDFQRLVESPAITPAKQGAALTALSQQASLNGLTVNFLQVLASNRRLMILNAILNAFAEEMSARRGEVKAHVKSATPLSADQEKELQAKLKQSLSKDVRLDIVIDKSLLGGLIITVGSKQIDDSVKSKLNALKQTLTSSNSNNNLKEVG
jgi:F-type H+-transporting ATPase subunit delta